MSYFLELLNVNDFFVVPKYFIRPDMIEKRNPLSDTARRAGWIGSNIIFLKIPKAGQIFYVENGKIIPKKDVLDKWQKTIFLKHIKQPKSKGWILDIMNCIDLSNKKEFESAKQYGLLTYSLMTIKPILTTINIPKNIKTEC